MAVTYIRVEQNNYFKLYGKLMSVKFDCDNPIYELHIFHMQFYDIQQ